MMDTKVKTKGKLYIEFIKVTATSRRSKMYQILKGIRRKVGSKSIKGTSNTIVRSKEVYKNVNVDNVPNILKKRNTSNIKTAYFVPNSKEASTITFINKK